MRMLSTDPSDEHKSSFTALITRPKTKRLEHLLIKKKIIIGDKLVIIHLIENIVRCPNMAPIKTMAESTDF